MLGNAVLNSNIINGNEVDIHSLASGVCSKYFQWFTALDDKVSKDVSKNNH